MRNTFILVKTVRVRYGSLKLCEEECVRAEYGVVESKYAKCLKLQRDVEEEWEEMFKIWAQQELNW